MKKAVSYTGKRSNSSGVTTAGLRSGYSFSQKNYGCSYRRSIMVSFGINIEGINNEKEEKGKAERKKRKKEKGI